MTTRVAIYHRVSTRDQAPALVRRELRAAARRLGRLVLEVEEVGSGARTDRPGWQRVLELARRGGLDQVLVWKLDRAGRSTLDLLANIEALTGTGVRFTAVTQGLDIRPGGDSMSRLLLTMLAGVAEFERDVNRERTGSAWWPPGAGASASEGAPPSRSTGWTRSVACGPAARVGARSPRPWAAPPRRPAGPP